MGLDHSGDPGWPAVPPELPGAEGHVPGIMSQAHPDLQHYDRAATRVEWPSNVGTCHTGLLLVCESVCSGALMDVCRGIQRVLLHRETVSIVQDITDEFMQSGFPDCGS